MINVDIDSIVSLEQAKAIISKLLRGMGNCPSSDFSICPKCGEVMTVGWICPNCRYGEE